MVVFMSAAGAPGQGSGAEERIPSYEVLACLQRAAKSELRGLVQVE
jgi:hypothetical protein